MHTALDELQTARLHRLNQFFSCRAYGPLWSNVESEVGRTTVDGPLKSGLFMFVQAKEQKLRDCDR